MAGKIRLYFGFSQRTRVWKMRVGALPGRQAFRNTDISVLFPENEGTKDFAHKKETKGPEGATTGATTGAIVGVGLALAGWRGSEH